MIVVGDCREALAEDKPERGFIIICRGWLGEGVDVSCCYFGGGGECLRFWDCYRGVEESPGCQISDGTESRKFAV